jgi:lysophospholipase L1-like esterase
MLKSIILVFLVVFGTAKAKGEEVRIFGDSVFAQSGIIAEELRELSQYEIVSHAKDGATMGEIQDQYRLNKNDVSSLVVMNGGANDVLRGGAFSCMMRTSRCLRVIDNALMLMRQTLDEMAEDGVKTIVWVGYYRPINAASTLRRIIDYITPLMEDVCSESAVECRIVDPREEFSKGWWLIQRDGIHPTDKGSRLIASLIWETMREYDIDINESI